MEKNLSFGSAIEALQNGKRVSREGWNGKGMFIFREVPAIIDADMVPQLKGLPQTVKDEFIRRGGPITFQNQLAMVYPNNAIYGWVASPSDVLENDWCVLD